jgi:predicted restriction endonuclease
MYTLSGPVSLSLPAGAVASNAAEVTVALIDFSPESFDPEATDDGREKVIAEVVRRQGQPRFRRILLSAYDGRCAMSDYDAEPALEAAHIIPYRGRQTNHPANGLLLRADLHDLFDLGLIAANPSTMRLHIADGLAGTMYEPMHDRALRLPSDRALHPSLDALEKHFERSAVA